MKFLYNIKDFFPLKKNGSDEETDEGHHPKENTTPEDEASSIPQEVFSVYHPTIDEMVFHLSAFIFYLLAKKINKEISRKERREDGTK